MQTAFSGRRAPTILSLVAVGLLLGGCCAPREHAVRVRTPGPNCVTLALPTGAERTSVIRLEKCGPREVRAGELFEYAVQVTNLTDNIQLRNVAVRDLLPATFRATDGGGAALGEQVDLQYSADAATETGEEMMVMEDPHGLRLAGDEPGAPHQRFRGTAAQGQRMVEVDVGDLAPGQTRTVTIRGVAIEPGTLTNCGISAVYEPFACLTTDVTAPQLRVSVTVPDEIVICEDSAEANLTFNVQNIGTGTAQAVQVTPLLPAELTIVGGTPSLNVGDLAAGQSKQVPLKVRLTRPGVYVVNARATSARGLSASAGDTRFAARASQLDIAVAGPKEEFAGLPVEYEIKIMNRGEIGDPDVSVELAAPGAFKFDRASAGGQPAGERIKWHVGPLEPGASRTMLARYISPPEEGSIQAVATVEGACGKETASTRTDLRGVPAMLVEVVDIRDPHKVGETEEYEIRVTNQGSAPETNIRIQANLPDEMTFVSASGPSQPTMAEDRQIRFTLPSLAPKQTATWRVIARCDRPGDLRFEVNVQSDEHDRPVRETEATRVYD